MTDGNILIIIEYNILDEVNADPKKIRISEDVYQMLIGYQRGTHTLTLYYPKIKSVYWIEEIVEKYYPMDDWSPLTKKIAMVPIGDTYK